MAKYRLLVNEVISREHEIIVDSDLTETQLDEVLNDLENSNTTMDFADLLINIDERKINIVGCKRDKHSKTNKISIYELEELNEREEK